jgi:hypothetical protein
MCFGMCVPQVGMQSSALAAGEFGSVPLCQLTNTPITSLRAGLKQCIHPCLLPAWFHISYVKVAHQCVNVGCKLMVACSCTLWGSGLSVGLHTRNSCCVNPISTGHG